MTQRFQFPLTDRDRYAGKVTFQAFETIPPTIRAVGGTDVDTDSIDPANAEAVDGLASTIQSGLDRVRFEGREQIRQRDRCSLFLPQGITFQDGVVFDEFALGRVGGATEAAIANGGSVLAAAGAGLQQNINALTDIFQNTPTGDVARLAAARVSKVAGGGVQGGVQSALRVTTNPNKRLLFKEVNIREFSFNFKLAPTSQNEAEEITKIIKFFRTELYPDDSIRVNTNGVSIPIGYNFPNQFIITFKHGERNVAHRILPAYLVSMQTTYNPTGMGFFRDGNFTETEITLNFRESRTLSKREVRDENY